MKTGEFGKALGGDRRERCVVVVELFWEVFRVGVQVFGHLLHVGPSKEAPQRARFRLGSKHKVHGEIRQAEAGFFRDTGTFLMRAGRSPHQRVKGGAIRLHRIGRVSSSAAALSGNATPSSHARRCRSAERGCRVSTMSATYCRVQPPAEGGSRSARKSRSARHALAKSTTRPAVCASTYTKELRVS